MAVNSDRPIGDPNDDALGFGGFAKSLATALMNLDPSAGLALAVEGAWGSGKSSALALATRLIKLKALARLDRVRAERSGGATNPPSAEPPELTTQALDERWERDAGFCDVHLVRFNPWNWSGQDNLVRAFFMEAAEQIGHDPDGPVTKWLRKLAGYAPSFLGGVTGGAALAFGAVPSAGAASGAGRALGETTQAVLGAPQSLEKAKAELAKALRELGKRVIVIVDDLDRLLPAEMRTVLSLVKSLGDLPNVIYVLAYDPEVVRKALASERIEPDFIQKIVQVTLALPPARQADMRRFAWERLKAATGGMEALETERWGVFGVTPSRPICARRAT
jgi:predicted KAP-like P-loop ATPase